jgi:hypothetical protein
MAKKKDPAAVSLGRRGGQAKVPKGLAMLSAERRKEIAAQGVAKRRENAKKKK